MELTLSYICVLIGISGIIWAIIQISRGIDSEEWPRIDAEITDMHICDPPGEWSNEFVDIRYTYSYMSIPYKGTKLKYGKTRIRKREIGKFINKHRRGSTIQISVDPQHHSRSVIDPGLANDIYFYVGFFTVIAFVGIATIVLK